METVRRIEFSKGSYMTRCGYRAVVAQVKSFGELGFMLRGAIQAEPRGPLYPHTWTIEGVSIKETHEGGRAFDLMKL